MLDPDAASLVLSGAILRGGGYEIEALALEAIAEDTDGKGLAAAVAVQSRSEAREGALGLEIVASAVVAVVVEATRQFWTAYSKRMIDKAAARAGDLTVAAFNAWFRGVDAGEQERISNELADRIRKVAADRGLTQDDIDALVAATASERLRATLSDG